MDESEGKRCLFPKRPDILHDFRHFACKLVCIAMIRKWRVGKEEFGPEELVTTTDSVVDVFDTLLQKLDLFAVILALQYVLLSAE